MYVAEYQSVIGEVGKLIEPVERERARLARVTRNAADAGAALARAVYEFTENPEGVGTDALEAAYSTFMGLHAGNFS